MSKKILASPSGIILRGLQDLDPLIFRSLGPNKSTTLIGNTLRSHYSGLLDRLQSTDTNREALQLLLTVAGEVKSRSGSGIRPALILTSGLASAVHRLLVAGIPEHSLRGYLSGLSAAFEGILFSRAERFSSECSGLSPGWLERSAATTACGDPQTGGIIGDICGGVGSEGYIKLSVSHRPGITITRSLGYTLEYKSLLSRDCKAISGPTLLWLSDSVICDLQGVLSALVLGRDLGRSLLIMAPAISKDVRKLIEHNVRQGTVSATAVIPPEYELDRHMVLRDLSLAFGTPLFGDACQDFRSDMLAPIDVDITGRVLSMRTPQVIPSTVARLSREMRSVLSPRQSLSLRRHLCALTGKSAELCIGGESRVQAEDYYNLVESTVQVVRGAQRSGFIPGSYQIFDDFRTKFRREFPVPLLTAMAAPFDALMQPWRESGALLVEHTSGDVFDVTAGVYRPVTVMGLVDSVFSLQTAVATAVSAVKEYVLAGILVRES